MLSLFDQTENEVILTALPKRIISLVPSQTELLYDLGVDDGVVGITKFCIHPQAWFRTKARVGGTKTISIQRVAELEPDLIIGNKEENVKEQIEELRQIAPTYLSDVSTLEDALQMIKDVGELTGTLARAQSLVERIQGAFNSLSRLIRQNTASIRTAYLIWKEPYMTVGGDTFIHDMMRRCGFDNIFQKENRYPQIEINELEKLRCQLLLLSSEPYPFKQKQVEEFELRLSHVKILLVDGEMFSWYGSRVLKAPKYFGKLIAQVTG